MDNKMAGGVGGPITCYAPMKPESVESKGPGKPPITCYAPLKTDTVEKGSSEKSDIPQAGKSPTALCYMPADDTFPFCGSEPKAEGLSEKQVQNRMDLLQRRAEETK